MEIFTKIWQFLVVQFRSLNSKYSRHSSLSSHTNVKNKLGKNSGKIIFNMLQYELDVKTDVIPRNDLYEKSKRNIKT